MTTTIPHKRAVQRLWPLVINIWLAAVLLVFFLLRVIGSNTVQNLLKRSTAH